MCNRGYGYNALYRYTPEGYLGELVNRAAGGTEVSHHMYQYDPLGRRTRGERWGQVLQ
ncbi:RHS repeat-associated core domain protein [Methylocaldum marinum]|uniref:RHS repeat-associated core domain protein n=1 Tax=Methylocaldum marinum TaxID=1432792 RepID=A0A250KQ75_9GAMM|nr:RHS repeat-associated core domain protein [Methylocaldum marinum]